MFESITDYQMSRGEVCILLADFESPKMWHKMSFYQNYWNISPFVDHHCKKKKNIFTSNINIFSSTHLLSVLSVLWNSVSLSSCSLLRILTCSSVTDMALSSSPSWQLVNLNPGQENFEFGLMYLQKCTIRSIVCEASCHQVISSSVH